MTFLGTDIDHDGGKIILVSGVPRRAGDDEQRMLITLRQITSEELPLGLRIGVNTGPVFAGDVGTPFRRTFTVMGDTVNLAARLMAKASPGQVLATSDVLDRSSVRFATTPLPPFMVKGKKRPVTAYAVGAAHRSRDHRVDRLPLTGVADELQALGSDLDAVMTGAGRVVEIVGDQGTGKSRLVEELARRAGTMRAMTILCESYETTTPYASIWYLGRALLGLEMDADRATAARHLRAKVELEMPELLPQLPLIGTALDLDLPDTPETAALKPEFRRQAVTKASARFLAATLDRPFLLMVEDAHHMDEASQGVMQDLARQLTDRSGLLCVTRRNEDAGFRVEPAPHVRTLPLRSLTMDEAAEALVAASDDSPMLPHEIRKLAERSMGNPMFLEELWRAHRSGAPRRRAPGLGRLGRHGPDRPPLPRDRQLLRYAAVLGTTFSAEELIDLLEPETDGADPSPEGPADTGWITPALKEFLNAQRSDLIRFRSAIVRDCAYEGLPFRRRRELHGRAAHALMARTGDDSEAELLSLHFFHAQRYEEAWRYGLVAGDRAGGKYANLEAATLYQRALASVVRLPDIDPAEVASAWEHLGDVRERAGDYRGASLAYRRARKLLGSDMVAQAELCLKEAWMPERVGRYSEAVRWIRRGLHMIDGVDGEEAGRLRSQLMTWYAAVRQAQGRSREAVTWCEQAINEARTFGDRDAEAHAMFTLDSAWVWLGRTDLATNSNEALAIYDELGDLAGEAVVLNNLGAFEYFRGAWDEAAGLYARGRDARLATGNDVDAAIGTINIGEILADQGRYEEGRHQLVDALRVVRAASYRYGIAYATMLLGRLESRTGSFDLAHAHFDCSTLRVRRHRTPFRCFRGGFDGGGVPRARGPEPRGSRTGHPPGRRHGGAGLAQGGGAGPAGPRLCAPPTRGPRACPGRLRGQPGERIGSECRLRTGPHPGRPGKARRSDRRSGNGGGAAGSNRRPQRAARDRRIPRCPGRQRRSGGDDHRTLSRRRPAAPERNQRPAWTRWSPILGDQRAIEGGDVATIEELAREVAALRQASRRQRVRAPVTGPQGPLRGVGGRAVFGRCGRRRC